MPSDQTQRDTACHDKHRHSRMHPSPGGIPDQPRGTGDESRVNRCSNRPCGRDPQSKPLHT